MEIEVEYIPKVQPIAHEGEMISMVDHFVNEFMRNHKKDRKEMFSILQFYSTVDKKPAG